MSTATIQTQVLQRLPARSSARCLHHRIAARISIPPAARPPLHLSPRVFSTSPRARQDAPPSSSSPAAPATPPPAPSNLPPQQPPPPNAPRRRPRFFFAIAGLLIGYTAGMTVRTLISPPPPPRAGSLADEVMKAEIRARAKQLPIVKKLLAEPGWKHHEAYSALPPSSRPQRITTGPLSTAAAIGAYQHIFHPPPTQPDAPIISVLHLGPAVSGWPGVAHGGLLSTLLDEHSARAALAAVGGGAGVLTANLDVAFLRPTRTGGFYVAKARALRDEELPVEERGKRARKVWVDVWIETLEGVECVRARALFVIPKGRGLRGIDKGF